MNKRYMDFVPARPAKKKPTPKTAPKPATVSRGVHRSPKISKSSLGTIEPLSAKPIKAQKVGNKAPVKPVEKLVEKSRLDKSTYRPPKATFINQDKIKKRPLSKNVYRRAISAKEEPKGPVTIITKPEKDAKAGLIVTIILTIILGAAAGTVAFLLLPK